MLLDTPSASLSAAGPLLLLDWRGGDATGAATTYARACLRERDGPDVLLVRTTLAVCAAVSAARTTLPVRLAPHARALALVVPGAGEAGRPAARATLALRVALARLNLPWTVVPHAEAAAHWCAHALDPPVPAQRVVNLLRWVAPPAAAPRRAA